MKIISTKNNLQILHEDNHLIVVNKRVGDLVQGDKTGDKPLSEVVKEYLKEKYNKQVCQSCFRSKTCIIFVL